MRAAESSGAVVGGGVARSGQKPVRLSEAERASILRAVERVCREAGATWRRILLFGSRTDLARRGGDIDLLVELALGTAADMVRLKQQLRLALEDELGEQKIDIIIDDATQREPFIEVARSLGVELWIKD